MAVVQSHDADETMQFEMSGIVAGYDKSTVLQNVDLSAPQGSIVVVLGPNGAGKTTLMRVAAGLLRSRGGAIRLDGVDLTRLAVHERVRAGLSLIPEGRGIFRSLSVRDNLELSIPRVGGAVDVQPVLDAFPALTGRLRQVAGSLSGGEQQMLALGRAYLAKPKVLLVDEVSMGLAPKIVATMYESIRAIAASGCTIVLVEQYATRALDIADKVYLLSKGTMHWSGAASSIESDGVISAYLGLGPSNSSGARGPI